ncbi:MAG: DUF58 domain-containing protein [Eubacterium sp.]|nr:DUF58 domain-containing protein [Eubacterium sp.]
MNYDFLTRIRTGITLYAKKKTSNLLDGDFRSIFRGRSLDFDDLREYSYGDNVRDIDWKASSKTGKMLIRRYIAERKHNILLIGDSGHKMIADTDGGAHKEELAVMALGTIAWLANRHGDDFALLMNRGEGLDYSFFKSGEVHFERIVRRYETSIGKDTKRHLGELLTYVAENFRRRMLVFIVTDMDGETGITDTLLQQLTVNSDVMIISISDAYLTDTGSNTLAYDIEKKNYEAEFLQHSRSLAQLERRERKERHDRIVELCKQYDVGYTMIRKEDELIDRIVDMIEEHKGIPQ